MQKFTSVRILKDEKNGKYVKLVRNFHRDSCCREFIEELEDRDDKLLYADTDSAIIYANSRLVENRIKW